MSLLDQLRKNLTPELLAQVTDSLGDDFDYDVVPRTRLNKVIQQRNSLREMVDGGAQPPSTKPKAGKATGSSAGSTREDEDDFTMPGQGNADPVDVEALKTAWLKEQGDMVAEVKIQFAALEKLREAKAIDPELIWKAGLVDKSTIKLDEKGNITGLDEAIKAVTESSKHLFGSTLPTGTGTGQTGGEQGGLGNQLAPKNKEEFLKLPYPDQLAFKKASPESFKTFFNQM